MDLSKDFLWPICNLLLILVIYFVRHWTDQHLVVGSLGLLALPCFLVLPESPRHSVIFGLKKQPHEIITAKQRQTIIIWLELSFRLAQTKCILCKNG